MELPELPDVFAVYRRDTSSFQLLQSVKDESNSILKLKCWTRPYVEQWVMPTLEQKEEFANWFRGKEWYVVPSKRGETLNRTLIHEKEYVWWHLGYDLVWTNSGVFNERNSVGTKEFWESSPRIPIIEFNTKRIYPRAETGFYPRWILGRQTDMNQKSEHMWEIYFAMHVEPSELRIRTPIVDEDYDEDDDLLDVESDIYFLGLCSLSGLLISVVGLYGYIASCLS